LASEAAGSGEAAAFDGETLDRMSEAAFKSLYSQLANGNHSDDDSAGCDDAHDQNAGSKIIDGEKDVDCEASWSFVGSDVQHGEDDDVREMARAVVSLGSALFNSDNVLRLT
jgi:hypothetical protein